VDSKVFKAQSKRKIILPFDVIINIFEYIHACGYFHLLYFPRPLREANDTRKLPISALISMNDTNILEELKHVVLSFRFREKIRTLVAKFGSFNTIQWFLSNGVISWNINILKILSLRGELQSLKLLIANGSHFSYEILYSAGQCGRENIIQCFQLMFLLERKIDGPLFQHNYISKFLEYSAFGNHLNVILWMLKNYHSETTQNADDMIFGAVKGGHIEMLEWIKVNISPLIWEDERLKRFRCGIVAARNKHLQLLQWLQNNGFKFNHRAYTQAAAFSGSLEVLRYLRSLDPPCPWSFQVCTIAVKQGNMEMLQWAIFNDCPCFKKKQHLFYVVASKEFLLEPW
jgi:hypothetical protein